MSKDFAYPFSGNFMQSLIFRRLLSVVSTWCVAFAVLGTSLVQAAEFKPFLTLKIAGPGTVVGIAEKVSSIADPTGSLGVKAMLTPYKNLPGINANGAIGLTLQSNENSPLGVDAILVLPISNFDTFNIPGQEMYVGMLKSMLQKEGNKFMLSSPFGEFVAYQKTGYLVVAPVSAAEFASTADPKTILSDLDKFTLGMTFNLENISLDEVEAMLGSLTMMLAMQGMEFDPDLLFEAISGSFDEISSFTGGVTMDDRTLNLAISGLTVPKKGSETAEKFLKMKNTKTKLGGIAAETSKTIFAYSYVDYLTDREIAEAATALELVSSSFVEGMSEAIEDEDTGEQFVQAAEIFSEYLHEIMDYFTENRLIDCAYSLDSDGTLIMAIAADKTDKIVKLDEEFFTKLYNLLPEWLGEEEGKALQQLMSGKIKRDYETVAGYSLSCLPALFTELPPGTAIPRALKDLPVSSFWAVKKDEAVVYAVGLDFVRTERTLKAALEKTRTSVPPKQTAVFALKPLGEFLLKQVLPFVEKMGGMTEEDIDGGKELFTILSGTESGAKIVVTTEFPNDAHLQKVQIDGKCITAVIKLFIKQGELTAKRFAREFQKQQQQETIRDF